MRDAKPKDGKVSNFRYFRFFRCLERSADFRRGATAFWIVSSPYPRALGSTFNSVQSSRRKYSHEPQLVGFWPFLMSRLAASSILDFVDFGPLRFAGSNRTTVEPPGVVSPGEGDFAFSGHCFSTRSRRNKSFRHRGLPCFVRPYSVQLSSTLPSPFNRNLTLFQSAPAGVSSGRIMLPPPNPGAIWSANCISNCVNALSASTFLSSVRAAL